MLVTAFAILQIDRLLPVFSILLSRVYRQEEDPYPSHTAHSRSPSGPQGC
jgi:hypothetical protein